VVTPAFEGAGRVARFGFSVCKQGAGTVENRQRRRINLLHSNCLQFWGTKLS